VYQAANGGETEAAVFAALQAGYRHIDTAEVYRNEEDVGKAIKQYMAETGMSRNELWVTTKYMPSRGGSASDPAGTKQAVQTAITASLAKLGLDYVDLYLMHSPHNVPNRLIEWEAFCELKDAGVARSIGVSNYGVRHLSQLLAANPKYLPVVNQIELNPYITRTDIVAFCHKNEIAVEAYSPLTKAQKLNDPKLVTVASKYKGMTTAQLLIRWCLQRDVIVIPKSSTPRRIIENCHHSQVFDTILSEEDMATLDAFDEYLVTGWDPTKGP